MDCQAAGICTISIKENGKLYPRSFHRRRAEHVAMLLDSTMISP